MNGALEYSRGGGSHPEVVDLDENEDEKEKEKEGGKKYRRSSEVSCQWRRPSTSSDSAQFWESSKGSEDATDREVATRDNGEGGGQNGRDTHHSHSVWQTFKKVGVEFNQDARKMFRYVGRKLRSGHGARETKVKEIYIVPDEGNEERWARRIAGSSHRRSSSGF